MKNIVIGIIIGGIIFTLGGVIAATTISSKNVTYQDKTVNNALDELYNEATTGKELVAAAITNKGITTTSSDTYETMASNINSIDTDHTEINQKLNNLESKHNSDISTITGSINNINQNLSRINSVGESIELIADFTSTSGTAQFTRKLENYQYILIQINQGYSSIVGFYPTGIFKNTYRPISISHGRPSAGYGTQGIVGINNEGLSIVEELSVFGWNFGSLQIYGVK